MKLVSMIEFNLNNNFFPNEDLLKIINFIAYTKFFKFN